MSTLGELTVGEIRDSGPEVRAESSIIESGETKGRQTSRELHMIFSAN